MKKKPKNQQKLKKTFLKKRFFKKFIINVPNAANKSLQIYLKKVKIKLVNTNILWRKITPLLKSYWQRATLRTFNQKPKTHYFGGFFLLIPKNTKKYQKIPKNTKKYQKIPKNTKKYQKIPKNTKKYQKIPKNTKKY